MGQHTTHSNSAKSGEVSRTSKSIAFTVGTQNIAQATSTRTVSTLQGDFQGNGRVDIVDFSIEAHWYKQPNPPAKYDLNHDGVVNIVDFSIMASHWTG